MADTRELILDRLYRILVELAPTGRALRNSENITSRTGLAFILLDGSEVVDENVRPIATARGQISQPLTHIIMSPDIIVLYTDKWETLGTQLNLWRSTLVKRIMAPIDPELAEILGTNGSIRYVGCTVNAPQSGERTEGRLELHLSFGYPFNASTIA